MVSHPEFTLAEWENAPEYWGPGISALHQSSHSIILDFESLQMIAAAQESAGDFRSNNVLGTPKAPIKLGDVPAAFIKVVSLNEDDYFVHTPHGSEILVVIDGILTVKNSRSADIVKLSASSSGFLRSGDVVALGNEGVQLTSVGLNRQAASLALSIMGIYPEQAELIIMPGRFSAGKEIDPIDARVNLPYEN